MPAGLIATSWPTVAERWIRSSYCACQYKLTKETWSSLFFLTCKSSRKSFEHDLVTIITVYVHPKFLCKPTRGLILWGLSVPPGPKDLREDCCEDTDAPNEEGLSGNATEVSAKWSWMRDRHTTSAPIRRDRAIHVETQAITKKNEKFFNLSLKIKN